MVTINSPKGCEKLQLMALKEISKLKEKVQQG